MVDWFIVALSFFNILTTRGEKFLLKLNSEVMTFHWHDVLIISYLWMICSYFKSIQYNPLSTCPVASPRPTVSHVTDLDPRRRYWSKQTNTTSVWKVEFQKKDEKEVLLPVSQDSLGKEISHLSGTVLQKKGSIMFGFPHFKLVFQCLHHDTGISTVASAFSTIERDMSSWATRSQWMAIHHLWITGGNLMGVLELVSVQWDGCYTQLFMLWSHFKLISFMFL